MSFALAAAPIAASVTMLVALRQSALRAGMAGLLVAILVVSLVPAFRLPLPELAWQMASGVLITLVVAYVLLGGLLLHAVLRESGALQTIAAAAVSLVPNPERRVLMLVLGLSVFFESATGFGVGIVMIAPVLLALGYRPRDAALVALVGQCAVIWGSLAIGTVLGAQLTGIPANRLGLLGAPLSVPLVGLCAGVAVWLTSGAAGLRRAAPGILGYSLLLPGALAAASHWVAVEVAGMLAGLLVILAGLAVTRGERAAALEGAAPREGPSLVRALVPFVLLLGSLLITRLVPGVRDFLMAHAVARVAEVDFALPVLFHSGFWLVLAALVAMVVLRLDRGAVARTLAATARGWLLATLALTGFLCFSTLMVASGMMAALASAIAAATGGGYIALLPFVGGLGGFLTASTAGSNAMFAAFQLEMAERLDLPADLVTAAQNAAGANTTLASPGRIVLAAAVTGLAGREGSLMRPVAVVALAGLLGLTAVLAVWVYV